MQLDLFLEDGYIPQKNDIVRFNNGRYDWLVTHVVPYANLVYVESLIGKKRCSQSITNISIMQRDTHFKLEKDHTQEYEWSSEGLE